MFERTVLGTSRSSANGSFYNYVAGYHRKRVENHNNGMQEPSDIHDNLYEISKQFPKNKEDKDKHEIEYEMNKD